MQQVRRLIDTIAPTDASVMILGETGTGKELVARSLHDKSRRADRAFIPVNCGALPENLVESELFGHRKGAFTGADTNRKGLFEVANGGTLFLDEVGELDKSVQVKLLAVPGIRRDPPGRRERAVPRRRPRPLRHQSRPPRHGRQRAVPRRPVLPAQYVRDLPAPSARAARHDIAALAKHLLARHASRRGLIESAIAPESIELLMAHDWPGNIRELANMIERATILAGNGPILPEHLPTQLPARSKSHQSTPRPVGGPHFQVPDGSPTLRDIEMKYIQTILEKHNGNKPAASRELGISLKTLYNKINQLQHMVISRCNTSRPCSRPPGNNPRLVAAGISLKTLYNKIRSVSAYVTSK